MSIWIVGFLFTLTFVVVLEPEDKRGKLLPKIFNGCFILFMRLFAWPVVLGILLGDKYKEL